MTQKQEQQLSLRLIRKFYSFLKREGIYHDFEQNYKIFFESDFCLDKLRNFGISEITYIFDETMEWRKTTQGYRFWQNYHFKWLSEAKKIISKYN